MSNLINITSTALTSQNISSANFWLDQPVSPNQMFKKCLSQEWFENTLLPGQRATLLATVTLQKDNCQQFILQATVSYLDGVVIEQGYNMTMSNRQLKHLDII